MERMSPRLVIVVGEVPALLTEMTAVDVDVPAPRSVAAVSLRIVPAAEPVFWTRIADAALGMGRAIGQHLHPRARD